MSGSITKAWLRSTMIHLISKSDGNFDQINCVRTVQVIRSNEQMRMLVINDKENSVVVMLTQNCMNDMTENEIAFSDLKNCLIKLEVYHFSTFKQSRGLRDFKSQPSDFNVSLPIILQCDKLTFLGGHDMQIIGEPRDLNKDPQSVLCFDKLNFNVMTERLGSRQFPEQNALPNSDGIFILHRHNDDDVEISSEQQRQLDQIDQERNAINMLQELSSRNGIEALTMVDENCTEGAQHYIDEGTLVDEDEFFDATGGCELEIINTQGVHSQGSTQHSSQSSNQSQSSSQKSNISHVSQHSTRLQPQQSAQSTRSLRSSIRPQDTFIGSRNNRGTRRMDANNTSSSNSSNGSLPTPLSISHVPTRFLRSQQNDLSAPPGLKGINSETLFSPSFSTYKEHEQPNWQTQPMTQDMLSGLEDSLSQYDLPESELNTPKEEKKGAKKEKKRRRESFEKEVIRDSQYDPKLINRKIKKKFNNLGIFIGVVEHYRGEGDYMIVYEDNDNEIMYVDEIMKFIVPAARTTVNSSHNNDVRKVVNEESVSGNCDYNFTQNTQSIREELSSPTSSTDKTASSAPKSIPRSSGKASIEIRSPLNQGTSSSNQKQNLPVNQGTSSSNQRQNIAMNETSSSKRRQNPAVREGQQPKKRNWADLMSRTEINADGVEIRLWGQAAYPGIYQMVEEDRKDPSNPDKRVCILDGRDPDNSLRVKWKWEYKGPKERHYLNFRTVMTLKVLARAKTEMDEEIFLKAAEKALASASTSSSSSSSYLPSSQSSSSSSSSSSSKPRH